MKNKILAATLMAATAFTSADASVFEITARYQSGATFSGTLWFDDVAGVATDVVGTLTGYQEGQNFYSGTGSSFINWIWAGGADFAAGPAYGTFLMSGNQPGYAAFLPFTFLPPSAGGPAFSSAGYGNSVVYTDGFVSGSITAVPEPATWAMMIAGFGLVGLGSRRARATTIVLS
jgi:hypothetical protein